MATVHSGLTDLLDPLGDCMTPEVARKVVQLRSSADANSRMQLLAGKSTARTLTDAEREEYDACVSAGTFVAILQAKARRMLGQNRGGLMDARGMRSSTSTAALPRETTRDRVRI